VVFTRRDISMTRSILFGLSLVLVCVASGCGGTDKQEAVLKEIGQAFNELADVMEGVKDKESAKEAAAKIVKLCDKFDDITKRAEALPKVTESQSKALEKKYKPDLDKAGERFKKATESAAMVAAQEPEMVKAMERLQGSMMKMLAVATKK
jgi:cytochrome c556